MNAFSDLGAAAATDSRASGNVVLLLEAGLHARPAVKLTKLAKKFASEIALATTDQGPWIDAKSIVKVMAAKPLRNSILHFRAEGADASAAIAAMVALVERDFSDDG